MMMFGKKNHQSLLPTKRMTSDASESNQEDEDTDASEPNMNSSRVPGYRSLIVIHAGKAKGGLKKALKIEPDKVRRLSLSEQGLEKATMSYGTDVVRSCFSTYPSCPVLYSHPSHHPPIESSIVYMTGMPADERTKKTKAKEDNWKPVRDEEFIFPLTVPELALLRVEVHEYDRSEKDDFACQTCLPVPELKQGIRTVPLFDRKGEKLNRYKTSNAI
ncbi:Blight resistance protein RGA1 [Hibiscus syriacus]|uniref:Blight resistance protein RGA1 n=1 Tax=Hibiscus syriacus TaxID=106335 RepID=A0A6A3CJA8_HIBSY|nr:Blight resistance protein RGA1 [Hibiscus syriacus]